MSARQSAETDVLRQAAALMREQAEQELQPYHPWGDGRLPARQGAEHWTEDVMGYLGGSMGEFCASWHPVVALAVADWLDAVAAVHWPKRHSRNSESHYNAEPEHDVLMGDCDESCYVEAYICNGCGTATCKPEITGRALAVARAYLGITLPPGVSS